LRRPTQRREASLMHYTLTVCMTEDIFAARRTIHYRLDPSMLHMAMDGLLRSFSCATSSPSPLSCDVSNTALPRLTANAAVLQFLFTLVINVGDHYPGLIPRTRSSLLIVSSNSFLVSQRQTHHAEMYCTFLRLMGQPGLLQYIIATQTLYKNLSE
jgi:hypothetical protein